MPIPGKWVEPALKNASEPLTQPVGVYLIGFCCGSGSPPFGFIVDESVSQLGEDLDVLVGSPPFVKWRCVSKSQSYLILAHNRMGGASRHIKPYSRAMSALVFGSNCSARRTQMSAASANSSLIVASRNATDASRQPVTYARCSADNAQEKSPSYPFSISALFLANNEAACMWFSE